jgi:hypothetical protein
VVLRFFKEACFFSIVGWEFLLSTTWRQGRSPNGDAVVFDNIETFVSFSSIWYVCVVVGHRMTVWQGSYQVKYARRKFHGATMEGCATVQISSVVFGFQFRRGCVKLVFRSLS